MHQLEGVVQALEAVDQSVRNGTFTYAEGLSVQQAIIDEYQQTLHREQARELGHSARLP